jgi:hypothetical protein
VSTEAIRSESPQTLTNGAPVQDTVRTDTGEITALLDEVRALMVALDGQEIPLDPDRGRGRLNKSDAAALNRELLRAVEMCKLAGGEIAMLYWRLRSYRDPRYEDGPTSASSLPFLG